MSDRYDAIVENDDRLRQIVSAVSLFEENSTAGNGGPSLTGLLELVGTAVFLISGSKFIYANAEAERISGYTAEELKSGGLFDTIHVDDQKLLARYMSDLLSGRPVPERDEVRLVTKAGEERWISLSSRLVELDTKLAILGTAIDITARKHADQALKKSEELYRSLVETSPDAIAVSDIPGKIVMLNQRAAELLGYENPEDLIGKEYIEWIAPQDRKRAIENSLRTIAMGKGPEGEYAILRRDGTEFSVAITASRIDDADGQPSAFLAAIRDLTDRKRIEEAERRMERLESLGLLAGGIAHDFNNILTAILGNIGMARRTLHRDPQLAGRKLDAAEGSVTNAKRLTQQLLTFSKGGELVTEVVYLGPVLRETTTLTLDDTNVKLELELPDELPPVDASPGQLRQVLSNLILNAAQAMPTGGTLHIEAREQRLGIHEIPPLSAGHYVELRVSDDGVGIPEAQLENVFDPYFSTKPGGTGLGLSTCYSIVRRHHGAIFVESKEDQGTTFKVFLPMRPTPCFGHEEPVGTRRGRVLVMDNDEIVREVAVSILLEAGYDACAAQDGREAIQRYRTAADASRPFDAVILDLNIAGGKEGKGTLKKLRKIDPNVRAIVSSGSLNAPLASEFALFGFQGAVAKPYTFSELCNAVQKVLEESP